MTRRTLLQSIAAFFAGLFGARGVASEEKPQWVCTVGENFVDSVPPEELSNLRAVFTEFHPMQEFTYSDGARSRWVMLPGGLTTDETNRIGRAIAAENGCHWTDITEA